MFIIFYNRSERSFAAAQDDKRLNLTALGRFPLISPLTYGIPNFGKMTLSYNGKEYKVAKAKIRINKKFELLVY